MDAETMKRLPKVPVLFHKSEELRESIEGLGFEARMLENNVPLDLGGLKINILAADNNDLSVRKKFLGCANGQVDSMAVFQDRHHTFVNANECPYQLSKHMLPKVKNQYPDVDMLFVASFGAGPYPQCFDIPEFNKQKAIRLKKKTFIERAAWFASDLGAKITFPVAGDYLLSGKLSPLNPFRGVPTMSEVCRYFEEAGIPVERIETYDEMEKTKYAKDVLARKDLDYEKDQVPKEEDLIPLLKEGWQRFEKKRLELEFKTSTALYIRVGDMMARISMGTKGNISIQKKIYDSRYVKISLDPRLLHRILQGPKVAHWSSAEIGSHLRFERVPDFFERGITHCLGFLHA